MTNGARSVRFLHLRLNSGYTRTLMGMLSSISWAVVTAVWPAGRRNTTGISPNRICFQRIIATDFFFKCPKWLLCEYRCAVISCVTCPCQGLYIAVSVSTAPCDVQPQPAARRAFQSAVAAPAATALPTALPPPPIPRRSAAGRDINFGVAHCTRWLAATKPTRGRAAS